MPETFCFKQTLQPQKRDIKLSLLEKGGGGYFKSPFGLTVLFYLEGWASTVPLSRSTIMVDLHVCCTLLHVTTRSVVHLTKV